MTEKKYRPIVPALVVDVALVLLYGLFLGLPSLYPAAGRGADTAAGGATLAWLALPAAFTRHGISLASATLIVTISALAAALAGTLLSIAGRRRGSAVQWATGAWLFGCSVAILMPVWNAVGFLGALLLLAASRARFLPLERVPLLNAVIAEICPAGYAIGLAVLAWRYNPQLLLQCLLIAFGASLVGRALLPSPLRSAAAEEKA